jgi:hypothetical protein
MQMAFQTRRLALNLDIQLMFLPGLSGSSRRLFPLWYLVFQRSFLMKDFKRTNLFACKLDLHMQMQLQTCRLMKSDPPTLSSSLGKKSVASSNMSCRWQR